MAKSPIKRVFFSPAEVAAQLGVAKEKVLGWIHAGELVAADMATKKGGQPRWKVSQQNLDQFIESRSTRPKREPQRRPKPRLAKPRFEYIT